MSNKAAAITENRHTKANSIAAKGHERIAKLPNQGSSTKTPHDSLHAKADESHARNITDISTPAKKKAELT